MAVTGRPREFDRDEALEAAMRLFWRKGYQATSMPDLCEAMKVRSPSIYAAYGSKEQLYLQAMERYGSLIGLSFWERVEGSSTARAGVESMLLAATESLPGSTDAPSGCMAMLAAVSDEWPHAIREAARNMRTSCLDKLRLRLTEAIGDGELPDGTDVDGMARLYFGIFQGMAVQAKDGARPEQLRRMVESAMAAWPA